MIKEITIYTVVCDGCGKDVNEHADYSGWDNKDFTESIAKESDWIKEDDNHFCPDCYEYDDDDNLIIKNKK